MLGCLKGLAGAARYLIELADGNAPVEIGSRRGRAVFDASCGAELALRRWALLRPLASLECGLVNRAGIVQRELLEVAEHLAARNLEARQQAIDVLGLHAKL